MTEKQGLKLIDKTIKFLEQEFPKRCKIKGFRPDCLSCRVNIAIGYLDEIFDLVKRK